MRSVDNGSLRPAKTPPMQLHASDPIPTNIWQTRMHNRWNMQQYYRWSLNDRQLCTEIMIILYTPSSIQKPDPHGLHTSARHSTPRGRARV